MRLGRIIDKILALIIIFMIIGLAVYAQAPAPSSNPSGAAMNAFSVLLLAAGAGYGMKQIGKNGKT